MTEKQTEPAHSFLLEDVERYGSIEKALIVKELRSMQIYKMRNGGQGWVYYSRSALAKKFPYMKSQSIGRWLDQLVDDGVLETTIQNKVKFDKTKSYRLKEVIPVAQNEQSVAQNNITDDIKVSSQSAQNEQTIPSHSSHSSHFADGLALKGPATGRNQDHRGEPSPAKERLREMIKAGKLRTGKR